MPEKKSLPGDFPNAKVAVRARLPPQRSGFVLQPTPILAEFFSGHRGAPTAKVRSAINEVMNSNTLLVVPSMSRVRRLLLGNENQSLRQQQPMSLGHLPANCHSIISRHVRENGLNEAQSDAGHRAFTTCVLIIMAPFPTGKTKIVKGLTDISREMRLRFVFFAGSNRAVQEGQSGIMSSNAPPYCKSLHLIQHYTAISQTPDLFERREPANFRQPLLKASIVAGEPVSPIQAQRIFYFSSQTSWRSQRPCASHRATKFVEFPVQRQRNHQDGQHLTSTLPVATLEAYDPLE